MTNLVQHSWLAFGGEPLAGLPPPQLLVVGAQELTEQQAAGVRQAYRQFKQATAASPAPYLMADRVLTDGTTLRIESLHGRDRVIVVPAPVAGSTELIELFRAVPADVTAVSGTGPMESKAWRLPGTVPSHWPSTLKDKSALIDHPGHVTWSNPNLKFGGKPIVVSWRGPRSRYATSTGWSTATGGTIVAHEESGAPIGSALFTDSGYVWINGHKIDTGKVKVIAACITQPDPIAQPDKYVLRICSDYAAAGTRGFKIFDLAPGGAAVSLKSICETKSLSTVATYTATAFDETPDTAGEWDMLQRPHFNRTGDKLTSIINGFAPVGIVGAVFDATTWAIDYTVSTEGSITQSNTLGSGTSWVLSSDSLTHDIIAFDFDGDTPVYLQTNTHQVVTATQSEGGNIYTLSKVWTLTWEIEHSSIGVLFLRSAGGTDTATINLNTTTGSVHVDPVPMTIAQFVGDLARGTFAIGYSATGISGSAADGTSLSGFGSNTFVSVTGRTADKARLLFDVYLDNVLAASQTTGGFINAAAATKAAGGGYNYVVRPTANSSTTNAIAGGVSQANSNGFCVQYKHCAVSPLRNIAYFGVLCYETDETPLRTNVPRFGLEIGVFNTGSGLATDNPPAYSAGSFSTLDAAVFQGPTVITNP